jgi:hypothetical protein
MNAIAKQLRWLIAWETHSTYDRVERLACTEFDQQEQGEEMTIRLEFLAIYHLLNRLLDQLHEARVYFAPMAFGCPNGLDRQFPERGVNRKNDFIQFSVQSLLRELGVGMHLSVSVRGKGLKATLGPDSLTKWLRADRVAFVDHSLPTRTHIDCHKPMPSVSDPQQERFS